MASIARLSLPLPSARALIPEFLCPLLVAPRLTSRIPTRLARKSIHHGRHLHTETLPKASSDLPTHSQLLELPRACPGCGAYTQLVSPDEPGFYSTNRKSVKAFIARTGQQYQEEDDVYNRVLSSADSSLRSQLGLAASDGNDGLESRAGISRDVPTPVCNRCHHLQHHHTGVPVVHPTLQSIQDIITESPHKYNHIYHVLDAADFPLSLIPSLQRRLSLSPLRSQNRRARTSYYQHGRVAEMSFIITRSDLLAPQKEQVDKMMPYLVQVLRDALGASAQDVRLGNVHCVSSKRGWWTKKVKEDIWNRGGGGWMVGKVNVGKSSLFENVFPKGRAEDISFDALRHAAQTPPQFTSSPSSNPESETLPATPPPSPDFDDSTLPFSLLPPAPPETPFPTLPLVSSLPGTTASPIRLPFGSGKGELIDLPGLARNDLSEHVLPEHHPSLILKTRPKPTQHSLRPGQSLLLGGLIRITPLTPDLNFLAYPFLPLPTHVTSTEKAIALQTQQSPSTGVPTLAKPGLGPHLRSAGRFTLKHDITKSRAGPLTSKSAVGLSTTVLPFIVFSTDILIEGCGWVELVAQVRKKDFERRPPAEQRTEGAEGVAETTAADDLFDWRPFPEVEVVSPGGGYVGMRRPMGAWGVCGRKPGAERGEKRPRRSMRGVKKRVKMLARGGGRGGGMD